MKLKIINGDVVTAAESFKADIGIEGCLVAERAALIHLDHFDGKPFFQPAGGEEKRRRDTCLQEDVSH